MKQAKAKVAAYYIECPSCGEDLENPDSGSLIFELSYSTERNTVKCSACGVEAILPNQFIVDKFRRNRDDR